MSNKIAKKVINEMLRGKLDRVTNFNIQKVEEALKKTYQRYVRECNDARVKSVELGKYKKIISQAINEILQIKLIDRRNNV